MFFSIYILINIYYKCTPALLTTLSILPTPQYKIERSIVHEDNYFYTIFVLVIRALGVVVSFLFERMELKIPKRPPGLLVIIGSKVMIYNKR